MICRDGSSDMLQVGFLRSPVKAFKNAFASFV
jgi:hypothetical protein